MKTVPLQPEALTSSQVGELLSISRASVYELTRTKAIPAPVELAGIRRWRRRELCDWLAAGAPSPRNDDWQWRPTVPAKLDEMIRARAEELDELNQRLAAGERTVSLSAHR